MKRLSWILLFSAISTVNFAQSAWTQTETEVNDRSEDIIELQTMTCREVLKSGGEDRANTFVFMHGYLSGQKGETTINTPVLADITEQILDTCIDNPDRTLITVFEESRQ